jgi:TolB protein
MKYIYFLLFVVLGTGCRLFSHQKKGYDYCYTNSHGLYVANYGHEPVRVYVNGNDGSLSPDGTLIAYTDLGAPDHHRRIGIFDLEAGKVSLLDTACHNCYGPVWSPDGNRIAYNAHMDKEWSIKYVDKEGKHPVELATDDDGLAGFYSPTWSADGKKLAVQNMTGVYIYDLDGHVLRTVPFQQLDSTIQFSNQSSFLLASKEDKLVFWGSVNESSSRIDVPTAVFVYDISTARTSRISPKGYDCWRPVLKGDTIYCRGRHGNSLKENTYRMDLDGGNFKVAYKDRVDISFARR